MKLTDKVIKGEFKQVGANEVHIDFVLSKWNHLWFISQYGYEYTLVKMLRKDSGIKSLKTKINPQQAHEIISNLSLTQIKSEVFNNASTWRQIKP